MAKELIYNDDGYSVGTRYEVYYEGYLFDGDKDGFNRHEVDNREQAFGIYDAYPDIVTVVDNYYGVCFANGEWY